MLEVVPLLTLIHEFARLYEASGRFQVLQRPQRRGDTSHIFLEVGT